ncbi:MAG: site-specific integrase, partial [Collinsella intestinalis]
EARHQRVLRAQVRAQRILPSIGPSAYMRLDRPPVRDPEQGVEDRRASYNGRVERRRTSVTELERCRGEYLNHLAVERNLAANTIAAYERDLRAYLAFLGERGTRRPDDVIRRDVEDFVAAKRADHAADASVNRALSAVKGFHRFMVREGLSSVNPTATLRVPKMGDHLPDVINRGCRALAPGFSATAAGLRTVRCSSAVWMWPARQRAVRPGRERGLPG